MTKQYCFLLDWEGRRVCVGIAQSGLGDSQSHQGGSQSRQGGSGSRFGIARFYLARPSLRLGVACSLFRASTLTKARTTAAWAGFDLALARLIYLEAGTVYFLGAANYQPAAGTD